MNELLEVICNKTNEALNSSTFSLGDVIESLSLLQVGIEKMVDDIIHESGNSSELITRHVDAQISAVTVVRNLKWRT